MKFTLRQMEIFLCVAEFENISKAAQDLSMSQSAASSALKDLESRYSTQLFDRIGKRLQLNELGKIIRPNAAALLDKARELDLELLRHDEIGRLKIGATMSIGNYLCVPLIVDFIAKYPSAKPTLHVANTQDIVHLIGSFSLDIAMIEGEVSHADLITIPWQTDELVPFCAPNHRLAREKELNAADIVAEPWILREKGSGTRDTFDKAMNKIDQPFNIRLELQPPEALKRAVESGLGISCLSKVTLQEAFKRGSLVPLKIPQLDLHRNFNFILHRNKYRTQGIKAWIELCNATIKT